MLNAKPTESIDSLFLNLRQLQVNLLKQTSKLTILAYTNQLKTLVENETRVHTNQESQHLIHFLIFPILVVLKREQLDSDLNELLLSSINSILAKIDLNDSALFQEILTTLALLLSRRSQQNYSDEFYLASSRLIHLIFNPSVYDEFFQFKNLTQIGLLVSLELDIILDSNSSDVRLQALKSLQLISGYNNNNETNDQMGVIFASFLPGVSIKLIQHFLLGQNLKLLNHKLICECLNLLTHVIANVLNDHDTKSKAEEDLKENIKSLIVNRNSQWLKETSDKLFTLIRPLLDELVQLENLNIQASLINFCSKLSNKCYFNLNEHLAPILRVLALYAANQDDSRAIDALKVLDAKETRKDGEYILVNKFTIVQNCLEEIILKLSSPTSLNESLKMTHLKTLFGYLKLIGTSTYQESEQICLREFFFLNLDNLNKLLISLIGCVSFDYKSLDNFYQIEAQNEVTSSIIMSNYSGLDTYLDDKRVYDQLSVICAYLGRSDAARLVVDQLLTNHLVYLQLKQTKCELMFLINLILKGMYF